MWFVVGHSHVAKVLTLWLDMFDNLYTVLSFYWHPCIVNASTELK